MFSVEDRERAHARVLALAEDDDRWSDLDLTFAVTDGVPVEDVLRDWTRTVERELGGRAFDDLPAEVLGPLAGAIVRSLDRDELLRALRYAVDGLLREGEELLELRALLEADTLS